MKSLDDELELPMDEDENIGDGAPQKKRVKRKKSKEERAAGRRVVFWTFLIIVGATICFWLWPHIRNGNFALPSFEGNQKTDTPKSGWKNYIEYRL